MSQNVWATIMPFGPVTNFLLAQKFFFELALISGTEIYISMLHCFRLESHKYAIQSTSDNIINDISLLQPTATYDAINYFRPRLICGHPDESADKIMSGFLINYLFCI
jgi:hypothetical protein